VKLNIDEKLATSYIGKHLLIGITYLDYNENFIEQKQFYGNIVRITSMKASS
jgi:hypothetical protein